MANWRRQTVRAVLKERLVPYQIKLTMDTAVVAALIGFVGGLAVPLITWWINRSKNPHEAIDAALDFARRNQFPGNNVTYRNSKWRRFRTRVSIMVDVCGPRRGVYLILIDRTGRVINIHQLRGWTPRC